MSNMTLEYTQKHHTLEVDGVRYEIPQRTPELEEQIREHDLNIRSMTEYDANMQLLEILFGKKNAKKMFPDKKTTNLDKLAKCTKYAVALFTAELNAIEAENIEEQLNELSPVLARLAEVNKTIRETKHIVNEQAKQ